MDFTTAVPAGTASTAGSSGPNPAGGSSSTFSPLAPSFTLLHAFPRLTGVNVAASVIQHLDSPLQQQLESHEAAASMNPSSTSTAGAAATAAPSSAPPAPSSWTAEHVRWSMECIGYALSLPLYQSYTPLNASSSSSSSSGPGAHHAPGTGLNPATSPASAASSLGTSLPSHHTTMGSQATHERGANASGTSGHAPSHLNMSALSNLPPGLEDPFPLFHSAVNIYTRWCLSTERPQAIQNQQAFFLQKMFVHLTAIFDSRSLLAEFAGATAFSPNSTTPSSQSEGRKIMYSMGSDPVLVGSVSDRGRDLASNNATSSRDNAQGSATSGSHSSASHLQAQQFQLDQKFIHIACRILHLLQSVGRNMSYSLDEATWKILLQVVLHVSERILVPFHVGQASAADPIAKTNGGPLAGGVGKFHSIHVSNALEPLLVRVLFDLWLRSQVTDAGLWKRFALLARHCLRAKWLMQFWRITSVTLTQKMWQSMFEQQQQHALNLPSNGAPTGTQSPTTSSSSGDRLTFKWPPFDSYLNESNTTSSTSSSGSSSSSSNSASSSNQTNHAQVLLSSIPAASYGSIGTTTTIYFAQHARFVFYWFQFLHLFGMGAIVDQLVASKTFVHPVMRGVVSPGATTNAGSPSMMVDRSGQMINPAASPVPHKKGSMPSIGSSNDLWAAAVAFQQQAAAEQAFQHEKTDRAERSEVYRIYVEGMVGMVDLFLKPPVRLVQVHAAGGGHAHEEGQPSGSAAHSHGHHGHSSPQVSVHLLPQNFNFLLQTFGGLLFQIAETNPPPMPSLSSPSSSHHSSSSSQSSAERSHARQDSTRDPSTAEYDGFEMARSIAVGCLIRTFSAKAHGSSDIPAAAQSPEGGKAISASSSIQLSSISRFYNLIHTLLSSQSQSSNLIVQSIFSHSTNLFTSNLPSVHLLLQAYWGHLRTFLAQTGNPDSSYGANNSQSGPSLQQKKYMVLTRIRRSCIQMLGVAVPLASAACSDAVQLAKLQAIKESPPANNPQPASARLAAGMKSTVASVPSSVHSTTNAGARAIAVGSVAVAANATHIASTTTSPQKSSLAQSRAFLSPSAFLLSHAGHIQSSFQFYKSFCTSFPHVLLNSLFSEQDSSNLQLILWTLGTWIHEEKTNITVASTPAGEPFPNANSGASRLATTSLELYRDPYSPSLHTFPHMALTTIWKLLIEDIWTVEVSQRAFDVLAWMAGFHRIFTHSNAHSVGNWVNQLTKYIERKFRVLQPSTDSNSNSASSSTSPTFNSAASSTPVILSTSSHLSPSDILSTTQMLLSALVCLESWLKSCPTILSPAPSSNATVSTPLGNVKKHGSPTSASGSSALTLDVRGSKELTASIVDSVLRGLNFENVALNVGSSTSMEIHVRYQQKRIHSQCMKLLQFILFDSTRSMSLSAIQQASGSNLTAAALARRAAQAAPQLELFKIPHTSVGWIFRGILSPAIPTMNTPIDSALISGTSNSLVLSERIMIAHLIAKGYLPSTASVDTNVKWFMLHESVLVSCIVYRTSPIHRSGTDTNASVTAPYSLLLIVRDLMGRTMVTTHSVLQPSKGATKLLADIAAENASSPPPPVLEKLGAPMQAEDAPNDKFWDAILYLEKLDQLHQQQIDQSQKERETQEQKQKQDEEQSLPSTAHVQAQLMASSPPSSSQFDSAIQSSGSFTKHSASGASTTCSSPKLPSSSSAFGSFSYQSAGGPVAAAQPNLLALPTSQWLAAQESSETHKLYWKLMQQQAQAIQDPLPDQKDESSSTARIESRDSTAPTPALPYTDTGYETLRTAISNLGWLTRFAPPASASQTPGTAINLLRPSKDMMALVEALDYGASPSSLAGGINPTGSTSLYQVGVLYRAKGQHSEREFYLNDTNSPQLYDSDYERLLELLHTSAHINGMADIEWLVASRMHSPRSSASAVLAQSLEIRKFMQRSTNLLIVWSRDSSEFLPTFEELEQEQLELERQRARERQRLANSSKTTPLNSSPTSPYGRAGNLHSSLSSISAAGNFELDLTPRVYILIWPQYLDECSVGTSNGSGINLGSPVSYRVKVLCSGSPAACQWVKGGSVEAIQRAIELELIRSGATSPISAPAQSPSHQHPRDKKPNSPAANKSSFWQKKKSQKLFSPSPSSKRGAAPGNMLSSSQFDRKVSSVEAHLDGLLGEESGSASVNSASNSSGAPALSPTPSFLTSSLTAGLFNSVSALGHNHSCNFVGPLVSSSRQLLEPLSLAPFLKQTCVYFCDRIAHEQQRRTYFAQSKSALHLQRNKHAAAAAAAASASGVLSSSVEDNFDEFSTRLQLLKKIVSDFSYAASPSSLPVDKGPADRNRKVPSGANFVRALFDDKFDPIAARVAM